MSGDSDGFPAQDVVVELNNGGKMVVEELGPNFNCNLDAAKPLLAVTKLGSSAAFIQWCPKGLTEKAKVAATVAAESALDDEQSMSVTFLHELMHATTDEQSGFSHSKSLCVRFLEH